MPSIHFIDGARALYTAMLNGPTQRAEPIRILFAEVLGLTAAVVREAIRGHDDMTILDREVQQPDDIGPVVAPGSFDVVVTSRSGGAIPPPYQQLLFGFPNVAVVAIGTDGRVEVYDRKVVREVALEQLADVIREVGRRHEGRQVTH